MADETAANTTAKAPSFSLIGQYIRDMSFENPGAPGSIMLGGPNPNFQVGINVGVKKQADDLYAVEITLNAKADREKNVLFNVELIYGGVFRMQNIPEKDLAPAAGLPILLIETASRSLEASALALTARGAAVERSPLPTHFYPAITHYLDRHPADPIPPS